MSSRRVATVLCPVLLVAVSLSGCSGDDPATGGASSTSAPSSSAQPAGTSTPVADAPDDGDNSGDDAGDDVAPPFPADTEPDSGTASAGASVTVTEIRSGRHDGYDRIVFEVEGDGDPGWDVGYVDRATAQGSGAPVDVDGQAVLQVALTGIGYPTETGVEEYDGSRPLPGNGTEVVTEVVWDSTFEGTSVAFVGTTERTPFRVYLLQEPTRVVLDVRHQS